MSRIKTFLWVALLFVGGILFPGESATPQSLINDTLSAPYRAALERLTSPELQGRIARRRGMQQQGYADALFHTRRGDGLWGIIAAARSRLQLEYSLPRTPLILYIPISQPKSRDPGLPGFTGAPSPPIGVPLKEDRTFPEDPWAKR